MANKPNKNKEVNDKDILDLAKIIKKGIAKWHDEKTRSSSFHKAKPS